MCKRHNQEDLKITSRLKKK